MSLDQQHAMAALAGVSPRTLRYYEERGIFAPTGHTSGGERRYGANDVARLQRIIEMVSA
jgi:DNA-binding transcriptional MerR regulator